jgi:hypothetical protein
MDDIAFNALWLHVRTGKAEYKQVCAVLVALLLTVNHKSCKAATARPQFLCLICILCKQLCAAFCRGMSTEYDAPARHVSADAKAAGP